MFTEQSIFKPEWYKKTFTFGRFSYYWMIILLNSGSGNILLPLFPNWDPAMFWV